MSTTPASPVTQPFAAVLVRAALSASRIVQLASLTTPSEVVLTEIVAAVAGAAKSARPASTADNVQIPLE